MCHAGNSRQKAAYHESLYINIYTICFDALFCFDPCISLYIPLFFVQTEAVQLEKGDARYERNGLLIPMVMSSAERALFVLANEFHTEVNDA